MNKRNTGGCILAAGHRIDGRLGQRMDGMYYLLVEDREYFITDDLEQLA